MTQEKGNELLTPEEEHILRLEWRKLNPNTRISWRDYWLTAQLAKDKQHYEQKISPYALPSDAYDKYFTPPEKRLDRPDREKIAIAGANAYFQMWKELSEEQRDNWRTWADNKILALYPEPLDRPDREKIFQIILPRVCRLRPEVDIKGAQQAQLLTDELLALYPDKFTVEDEFVKAFAKDYKKTHEKLHKADLIEAKREEKERIIAWGLERCPHWSGAETVAVGIIKRDCSLCWKELKEEK